MKDELKKICEQIAALPKCEIFLDHHLDRDGLAALRDYALRVEKEKDEWRLALESLTPGGSEFVNDLDACLRYAQGKRTELHEMHKRVARLEREKRDTNGWRLTEATQNDSSGRGTQG